MTRTVQLVFIFLVVFVTVQGQYDTCFNGGCKLVQSSGDLAGTQLQSLAPTTYATVNIGGALPNSLVQISIQKPCLLQSSQCAGKDGLNNHLPCCCEVKVDSGVTAESLIEIPGKFQGKLSDLLAWNGIATINGGEIIQLCQTDDSRIIQNGDGPAIVTAP